MLLPFAGKSSQLLLAGATLLLGLSAAGGAQAACSITYGTLSSTLPNVGNVVSAATGDTVFRVAASGGGITKQSGNGARTSSGTSQVSMTIKTANHAHCNNLTISGSLSSVGAPTGRAEALTNFDVQAGSNLSISGESGSSVRTFTITMDKNKTGILYIGMDFPIKGDNEGGATGAVNGSKSSYSLTLTAANGNDVTRTGTAVATVRRSLRAEKNSDLSFGRVVRPSTGTSTIALNATTGLRSVSGNAAALSTPAPARAWYTITGEGGQALSISIPSSVTMTGPESLPVTLTSFRPYPYQLSGGANSDGSYEFWVGGSFSLGSGAAPGTYSGTFAVTVAYN